MEDLQSLLEKINRDGVEKAEAEAKKIVDAAKAKADAIVKEALAEAAKAKAEAEAAAGDFAARGAETLRQGARDLVIAVKGEIDALFERALGRDVNAALADEKIALQTVADAIRDLAGPGEIRCGEKLAATLKAQAAGLGSFTVVTDPRLGTGFSVTLEGGRVEHSFSAETITAELARRLRPDLAKLLA